MSLWVIWIVVGILLLIGEIFTPGFVLACFGIACFVSGLFAALSFGIRVQFIVFSLVTLLVFFRIRPMMLKYLHKSGSKLKTNVDALVGKKGMVVEKIDPNAETGRIVVGGENWRGVSEDNIVVEKGTKIIVKRVEGTKLFVTVDEPVETA
ncbi:MAG: NfeD family protein [Candidatus Krumholzibacteriota bacterium]|nr:NfeD family protein [Candidatus Krumholzibacteriota bacterium]